MVYQLVKKDFLLAKKYWIIMLVAAIAMPIFISMRADLISGGFLAFFLSTLFIQFLLFNTVSMIEYKYKGSALLCATPYTRRAMVQAKYWFILTIFAGCYLFYLLASVIMPSTIDMLSLSEVGWSILIVAILFGTMIPVQYRFGYEKSKYMFMFSIFLFPFVFPRLLKFTQTHQFGLHDWIPFTPLFQGLTLGILAFFILWISMKISTRIYAKQNL